MAGMDLHPRECPDLHIRSVPCGSSCSSTRTQSAPSGNWLPWWALALSARWKRARVRSGSILNAELKRNQNYVNIFLLSLDQYTPACSLKKWQVAQEQGSAWASQMRWEQASLASCRPGHAVSGLNANCWFISPPPPCVLAPTLSQGPSDAAGEAQCHCPQREWETSPILHGTDTMPQATGTGRHQG